MIDRISHRPHHGATRRRCLHVVGLAALLCAAAHGAELYNDGDTTIRWDNTLRYSMAFRLEPYYPSVAANPNNDDGDRNFAPGLISNRLDLISVLDLTHGDTGFHVGGAAWYDSVYFARTANTSPSTYNSFSVSNARFPRAARNLHGRYAGLEDAFAFGNFDVDGMPLSIRAGRQTLLWGESLFFGENAIAAAQAPVDRIRDVSAPGSYSKEVFLPVTQIALSLQPRPDWSINVYYQLEWRKSRQPGVGSYFSYYDAFDAGGERLIVAPGYYLYRVKDEHPPSGGQFGVSLRWSVDDFDLGFYALRFHAKDPAIWLGPGRNADPAIGKVGEYQLFYPSGIELYGVSFSTYLGDSSLAGEFSVRRHMPLVSLSPVTQYWTPQAVYPTLGGYAAGDTLHGQVSSIAQFGPSSLWDSAEFSVEAAANYRLAVTANRAALDPLRDPFALSFRGVFEPRYFQVLPNLDISIPIGLGANAIGRSSVEDAQYAGSGDVEVGIAGTYRSAWRASVTLTSYFGSPYRQPFADRDFLRVSVERTF
jgi:hypothetical protein